MAKSRRRSAGLSRLRIMEFFLVGLALGILEDVLAILLATDATIDLTVIFVAAAVALPFAFISEIIVDQRRFPAVIKRLLKVEEELVETVERRLDPRHHSG